MKKFDTNQKTNRESLSHKVGDKIERVGEKISEKGAGKLGSTISRAGDKIEHMNDRKNSKV